MEPVYSWILVGFITSVPLPSWELLLYIFKFFSRFSLDRLSLEQKSRGEIFFFFFVFFCLFFVVVVVVVAISWAAPAAYGGSQARGLIGAVAASLHHSSQQRWILNLLSKARDQTCNLIVPSWIR